MKKLRWSRQFTFGSNSHPGVYITLPIQLRFDLMHWHIWIKTSVDTSNASSRLPFTSSYSADCLLSHNSFSILINAPLSLPFSTSFERCLSLDSRRGEIHKGRLAKEGLASHLKIQVRLEATMFFVNTPTNQTKLAAHQTLLQLVRLLRPSREGKASQLL